METVKTIKIGKKAQIVLPASIRKDLNLVEGDEVILKKSGNSIVLVPKPKHYAEHLQGLHGEIWREENPDDYVDRQREEWKE